MTISRIPAFRRLGLGRHAAAQVERTLQGLPQKDGWLVEEYARTRRFFTMENAASIEACWQAIESWAQEDMVTECERSLLIASLIDSMDRVANTAGTYYAYLKKWDRKALRPFRFRLITPAAGQVGCKAVLSDADDLVGAGRYTVLYLDPPYNGRRYSGYYHLPESISRGERPVVHGASGAPKRPSPSSPFYNCGQATAALQLMLDSAKADVVVFHYADDGLISLRDVRALLSDKGTVTERALVAPGYTTTSRPRLASHSLFILHHRA